MCCSIDFLRTKERKVVDCGFSSFPAAFLTNSRLRMSKKVVKGESLDFFFNFYFFLYIYIFPALLSDFPLVIERCVSLAFVWCLVIIFAAFAVGLVRAATSDQSVPAAREAPTINTLHSQGFPSPPTTPNVSRPGQLDCAAAS